VTKLRNPVAVKDHFSQGLVSSIGDSHSSLFHERH